MTHEFAQPFVQPGQLAGRGKIERRAQMSYGLWGGCRGEGDVCGQVQPLHRLGAQAGGLRRIRRRRCREVRGFPKVEGDHLGDRDRAPFAAGFEPIPGRSVEAHTLGARERLVGNLADQDVPERKTVSVRGPDQVSVSRLVEQPVEISHKHHHIARRQAVLQDQEAAITEDHRFA